MIWDYQESAPSDKKFSSNEIDNLYENLILKFPYLKYVGSLIEMNNKESGIKIAIGDPDVETTLIMGHRALEPRSKTYMAMTSIRSHQDWRQSLIPSRATPSRRNHHARFTWRERKVHQRRRQQRQGKINPGSSHGILHHLRHNPAHIWGKYIRGQVRRNRQSTTQEGYR